MSQFTTRFDRAGEYLIVCNEYCGVGHHVMSATLIVEDMPATTGEASAGTGDGSAGLGEASAGTGASAAGTEGDR
ncbi:MAG: hypothetical protein F4151_11435 [Gammaproteobacteria bacterium]|nr:hypothetical protein [Gammaproteobacteria bacterium]